MASNSAPLKETFTVHERFREEIRYARQPDAPDLIDQWLKYEHFNNLARAEQGCDGCPKQMQCELYRSQFQLLLDTVADELLPSHWREHCLNSIHRPLSGLKHLLKGAHDDTRLINLFYELSVTARYVHRGFYQNSESDYSDLYRQR